MRYSVRLVYLILWAGLVAGCSTTMEGGFGAPRSLDSALHADRKVVLGIDPPEPQDGRPTVYSYQLLYRASSRESDLILLQRSVQPDGKSSSFLVEKYHGRSARNMTSLVLLIDGRRYIFEDIRPDRRADAGYFTEVLSFKVKPELFDLLAAAQKASVLLDGAEIFIEEAKLKQLEDTVATLNSLGYRPPAEHRDGAPTTAPADDMTDRS